MEAVDIPSIPSRSLHTVPAAWKHFLPNSTKDTPLTRQGQSLLLPLPHKTSSSPPAAFGWFLLQASRAPLGSLRKVWTLLYFCSVFRTPFQMGSSWRKWNVPYSIFVVSQSTYRSYLLKWTELTLETLALLLLQLLFIYINVPCSTRYLKYNRWLHYCKEKNATKKLKQRTL